MNIILWIDKYFSWSLIQLFKFLFFSIILLFGVVSIPGVYFELFEYKEGLRDLSNVEIVFLFLFVVIIYRHVSYCFKYKIGIWNSIIRPFYALGALVFVSFAVIGYWICILYFDDNAKSIRIEDVFVTPNGIEQLIILTATLLAIYLATPTSASERMASIESPDSNQN